MAEWSAEQQRFMGLIRLARRLGLLDAYLHGWEEYLTQADALKSATDRQINNPSKNLVQQAITRYRAFRTMAWEAKDSAVEFLRGQRCLRVLRCLELLTESFSQPDTPAEWAMVDKKYATALDILIRSADRGQKLCGHRLRLMEADVSALVHYLMAKSRQSAKSASDTPSGSNGYLTSNDLLILTHLLDTHPALQRIIDIATGTGISDKTVGERLRLMSQWIHREGERGGFSLSEDGLAFMKAKKTTR